jgi:hypothetical protein
VIGVLVTLYVRAKVYFLDGELTGNAGEPLNLDPELHLLSEEVMARRGSIRSL